jgi:hypothetical protein
MMSISNSKSIQQKIADRLSAYNVEYVSVKLPYRFMISAGTLTLSHALRSDLTNSSSDPYHLADILYEPSRI